MNRKCKDCGELKPFLFAHKREYTYTTINVYKDDSGRNWHGAVCPSCVNNKVYVKKLVKRRCRYCKTVLDSSRYFYCELHTRDTAGILDDYAILPWKVVGA